MSTRNDHPLRSVPGISDDMWHDFKLAGEAAGYGPAPRAKVIRALIQTFILNPNIIAEGGTYTREKISKSVDDDWGYVKQD